MKLTFNDEVSLSKSEPQLSIVTATYDDPDGLRQTCGSLHELFKDSHFVWEHVVVDSSPEKNQRILSQLPPKWPLNHITMPPLGIYSAFNEGIEHATGKFIWFLNGGDELKSAETLNELMFQLIANQSRTDVLIASVELARNGHYLYTQTPKRRLLRNLVGSNGLCHQGIFYKRDVFKQTGLYSTTYKLASDYEHLYKVYESGLQVKTSHKIVARYDMTGASNDYRQAFEEFRRVHRELRPSLPLIINVLNDLIRTLDYARVAALKTFATSFFGPMLRPFWLAYKRLR